MATTSGTRSPAQIARETFEALFDRRDFAAARRFWSADSVDHFLALGIDVRGADALEAFFRELFAAVPDWTMTVENIVEDDRHAVVQWTGSGTFTGAPFQGIEPTGKPISLRGCELIRLAPDGTVDENTVYYDGAEFARQIGMLPPRDSALDRGITQAFNAATRLRKRVGV